MFDSNLKSRIHMNEITSPISKELTKANLELKAILNEFGVASEGGIPGEALKNPYRRIRQAMILLPVKVIGKGSNDKELFRICAAAEIIYSALHLHDGVSDSEVNPGKISRTKKVIDNSFAVLTGDTLQTIALLVLSEIFPKSLLLEVMQFMEKASYIKISDELQKPDFESKESYLNALESRTAEFMGTFALLGAYVSKANADEAAVLEKCWHNLSMAYRMIIDHRNRKIAFEKFDPVTWIKHFAKEAESAVAGFKDSVYKKSLLKLIGLFYSYYGAGTRAMSYGHSFLAGNVSF